MMFIAEVITDLFCQTQHERSIVKEYFLTTVP